MFTVRCPDYEERCDALEERVPDFWSVEEEHSIPLDFEADSLVLEVLHDFYS